MKIWIRATQERVFKALTEAKDLNRWFLGAAETDPRPGGKFKIAFSEKAQDGLPSGPDKGKCGAVIDSKFVEVVPHSKVSFLWSKKDELVTFLLTTDNGGTLVTLLHEGFSTDVSEVERFAGHGRGWTGFMCNLRAFLERDWDMREGA